MRLSFIIPCYNASKTVCRCLDSIYTLGLPEDEFEVITVNDASTDDTLQVIREYAKTHSNMVIMNHLVNRNVGAARNTGLAVARGNCISFVDSDDEVGPGLVTALKRMEEEKLDMIAMRVNQFSDEGVLVKDIYLQSPAGQVFSGVQFQTDYPYWQANVWSYLYKKELVEKVHYPFVEGAYYEDVDYLCSHLLFAERMSYCDESGYRFFANPVSITHKMSSKHVFGFAFLGCRMLSLYEKLEAKSSEFALTILEGGSWNIMKAFRYLLRLGSIAEVRDSYNLLDSRIDRESLKQYHEPAYCWTWWSRLGVKHRYWMTILAGIGIQFYRFRKKLVSSHNPA